MSPAPAPPAGFQPLEIQHRDQLHGILIQAQPVTSELTFTNLYMWRHAHRPHWRMVDGVLLILLMPEEGEPFLLPPVSAGGNLRPALDQGLAAMEAAGLAPRAARVPAAMVEALAGGGLSARRDRDQDDYVYLTQDLINLSGNRFHRKKNHLNRFLKNTPHAYHPLDQERVECVLDMQASWCALRDCESNPGLAKEDRAIYEALTQFECMSYVGGAIVINEVVEAFSLGEALNDDTVVIHIEKANPDIPGLYAAINQMFAQAAFSQFTYINREQDLGIPGLRKAKESYNPHHLVEKYEIIPS